MRDCAAVFCFREGRARYGRTRTTRAIRPSAVNIVGASSGRHSPATYRNSLTTRAHWNAVGTSITASVSGKGGTRCSRSRTSLRRLPRAPRNGDAKRLRIHRLAREARRRLRAGVSGIPRTTGHGTAGTLRWSPLEAPVIVRGCAMTIRRIRATRYARTSGFRSLKLAINCGGALANARIRSRTTKDVRTVFRATTLIGYSRASILGTCSASTSDGSGRFQGATRLGFAGIHVKTSTWRWLTRASRPTATRSVRTVRSHSRAGLTRTSTTGLTG